MYIKLHLKIVLLVSCSSDLSKTALCKADKIGGARTKLLKCTLGMNLVLTHHKRCLKKKLKKKLISFTFEAHLPNVKFAWFYTKVFPGRRRCVTVCGDCY